jgi:hypothetical protein
MESTSISQLFFWDAILASGLIVVLIIIGAIVFSRILNSITKDNYMNLYSCTSAKIGDRK